MKQTLHIYLNATDSCFSFVREDFAAFSRQHPDIAIQVIESEPELINLLPEIVWLDTWQFLPEWYALAPRLKGIFTPAAGKDYIAADPANAVAVHHGTFHGTMMAESALALVLHSSLNLNLYHKQQIEKLWQRQPARLLQSQSALIVGYGHIGRQCGRLLKQFGMQVWGHQRQPAAQQDGDISLISNAELDAHLPLADHVISFLPGDLSTRHFFSRDRLALISKGAYFYNFGRGTTVDEAALLAALQNNEIAGACLDVTETEPLPTPSELWHHPKVVLLPHAAAYYDEYRQLHVMELTELAFSAMNSKSSQ